MSHMLLNPTVVDMRDAERAESIRQLVKTLNSCIISAKQAGLKVELNLHSLGKPDWIGYQDAVKISREY